MLAFAMTERKENRTLREKSRFTGVKRFALRALIMGNLTAKSAIDNCRAGRAAKGASPVASTKNTAYPFGYAVFLYSAILFSELRKKTTR